MKSKLLKLPRMKLEERISGAILNDAKEMIENKSFLMVGLTKEKTLKVIHSELDDNMFELLVSAIDRHQQLFEVVKLSLIAAERLRNGHVFDNFTTIRAIEYLKRKST